MTYCQYCGEKLGVLPFTCNYCGGTFCSTHRLPENHACSFDEKFQHQRVKARAKEKERRKARFVKERDLGVVGMRSTIGTSILYIIILSMSILGAFFPYHLNITVASFFYYPVPFIWTFFTSIFVVPLTNVAELCYFIILMLFSYYLIRTFENRFGPKLLLITYLSSAGIIVLVNFYSSYILYYYGVLISFVKIGLAPAGILGLIFVTIVENTKRSWYFKNIRLKAVTVLILLIISSITAKIITTVIAFEGMPSEIASFYYSESYVYYMIDLIGPIVIIIIAAIYFYAK